MNEKQEQLTDFLNRYEIPGIRRVGYPTYPFASTESNPFYGHPQTTPEKVAEDLLAVAEFRALQLGSWLGTTDGQIIARAVELAVPPIYRPDVELLVDALKLAASIQQREGQKVAGLVAIGVLLLAGLLAFGSGPAGA